MPLGEALDRVLNGTHLRARVIASDLINIEPSVVGSAVSSDTVVGTVRDAETHAPIDRAVVSVQGIKADARTGGDGTFRIVGIPAGKYTVTIRRLGYRSSHVTVDIRGDSTTSISVALDPAPTTLNDVVTTATGEQRRAAVAAEVSRLNVDSVMATAPVRSMTDLLANRIPGVQVQRSSGDFNAPVRIRIGGISSMMLSNDPIIILDGVRIAGPSTNGRGIQRQSSPLDDIDPRSLESVEVVHGPAAAALYGTDAANGVIVLKSKKGTAGPTRWGLDVTHDWTTIPSKYPPVYLGYGHGPSDNSSRVCSLVQIAQGSCAPDSVSTFNPLNSPLTTRLGNGSNTQYSLRMQGGSNQVVYSLTGSYHTAVNPERVAKVDLIRARIGGMDVPSGFRQLNTPSSISFSPSLSIQPSDAVDIALNASVRRSSQAYNRMGSTGIGTDTVSSQWGIFQGTSKDKLSSDMGGATVTWRVFPSLTVSGTAGLQHTGNMPRSAYTSFQCQTGNCIPDTLSRQINTGNSTIDNYTGHLSVVYQFRLGSTFSSSTSYLGDYNRTNTYTLSTGGVGYGPGVTDISAGKTFTTREMKEATATAGMSIAEVLAFRDRMYLTMGVRRDAGSAFGSTIHAPLYPQAGFSWIVSKEPFFPAGIISNLQLRVAYGQSGVQPLYGQAYQSDAYVLGNINGAPVRAIVLGTVGNSQLEPERDAQFEGGITADLWGNRGHIDLTISEKRSHAALLTSVLAPSIPYGWQTQNVGAVLNRTLNLSTSWQIFDRNDVRWNVGVNASTLQNKVLSMGNLQATSTSSTARVLAGYPIFGIWQTPVLGIHVPEDRDYLLPSDIIAGDTTVYIGYAQPRYTVGYTTTLAFPRPGITITANASNDAKYLIQPPGTNGYGLYDPAASLSEQAYALLQQQNYNNWQTVSVFRLNSVQVNWALPSRLARQFRARSASLVFAGTNLGMWTKYVGRDPSINSAVSNSGGVGGNDSIEINTDDGNTTPLTRNWSIGLHLGF
jgi:outer membrane receptor protein involved in Fe transport